MRRLASSTCNAVLGKQIPVTLGGEHSLTYGAVSGIIEALNCQPSDLGIIQIDAHADLRCAYQDEVHSHASVMHLLAAEGVRIAQFGVRALCREEQLSRASNRVFFVDAEELVVNNIHQVALPNDFPTNVYISFDLDGLDPAVMPATGTPVPGGLSYYQSINLVASAVKSRNIVGMDVVELAPIPNQSGWDFTAAQLVYRLMGLAIN
jgi:agmatinase